MNTSPRLKTWMDFPLAQLVTTAVFKKGIRSNIILGQIKKKKKCNFLFYYKIYKGR